jgi:hypothetical protein
MHSTHGTWKLLGVDVERHGRVPNDRTRICKYESAEDRQGEVTHVCLQTADRSKLGPRVGLEPGLSNWAAGGELVATTVAVVVTCGTVQEICPPHVLSAIIES